MATNFSNKNISTIQLQGIDYHLKSIPFHATEEEWELIDYIPKQGETIVYDIDDENQNLRFKTGDGFTQVKNLPFSLSTVQETQSQIDEAVENVKSYVDAEITEWVGDTKVSEQITTAIKSHNTSSVTHSNIRNKALCVQELPYLIGGSVNNTNPYPSVIYGNGKYVAVELNLWNIRVSADGINWETSATIPVIGTYLIGAYGNGKYVFISTSNVLGYPIALYSEDAINWNYSKIEFTYNDNVISDSGWNKIAFENGLFILSGNAPITIYSEDAINWQASNEILYNGTVCQLTNICYGNGKFVTFSKSKFGNILPVFTSTDAITWIVNEIDMNLLDPSVLEHLYGFSSEEYSKGIVYGNNMFVAVFTENVTATSVDGVNWNFTANLPCYGLWSFITYRNGTFVAIANQNALKPMPIAAYSTDCIIWNVADNLGNPLNDMWVTLISSENKFLMTSLQGQCAYSSDGIDWTYAIKSVTTLFQEDKTSDLKEALEIDELIYAAEESVDVSAEVINADTLGGYGASDFRHSDWLPTAEEVGAAPAGFGLGAEPKYITDANEAILPGFYAPNGISCANIPSEWQFLYGTIIVSTGAGFVEQLFLASDKAARRTRSYGNGMWSWSEWVDISPSAFAPSGYGLGTTAKLIATRDEIDGCGFYRIDPTAGDAPDTETWWGTVTRNSGTYYTFTASKYNGCTAQSVRTSSGWQPWEWVNPPMLAGVEYRTIERYGGNPVYVKRVVIDSVPTGTVAILANNATSLVRSESKIEGVPSLNEVCLPFVYGSLESAYSAYAYIYREASGNIRCNFVCGANINGTAIVTVWYTK